MLTGICVTFFIILFTVCYDNQYDSKCIASDIANQSESWLWSLDQTAITALNRGTTKDIETQISKKNCMKTCDLLPRDPSRCTK